MEQFTFDFYGQIINTLRENGYEIADYSDYAKSPRTAILRHDIDFDIEKSAVMAEFEEKLGVSATYYVLLRSDFYNAFSYSSVQGLKKIMKLGGRIGLHFDEMCYPEAAGDADKVRDLIIYERDILSDMLGEEITTVSMHQPSRAILDAEMDIPGMINSYRSEYFRDMKYVSDSCRCWREPVMDIIKSREHDRLHILTHALWWGDEDRDIHDTLYSFVNSANVKRYDTLITQVKKYEKVLTPDEVR